MARKKHDEHEEHVNHEAWVIPYADLLTLLMGLFLVLWAMGKTDATKAQQVREGFAAELGIGPSSGGAGAGPGAVPGEGAGSTARERDAVDLQIKVGEAERIQAQADARETDIRLEQTELAEARDRIQAQLDARGLSDRVQMRLEPQGLIVVATDGLLFDSGSSALGGAGAAALDVIAEPMRSMTQPVRIEGHTDNAPISTGVFPSNWELSTARSSTVLRYLVDRFAFAVDRVSAAGYADTRPVAPNDTAEGRAANRRVEIVLIATKVTEPLPTGTDGVPGSSGSAGVPAPIGPDGPQGPPAHLGPNLPTPLTSVP